MNELDFLKRSKIQKWLIRRKMQWHALPGKLLQAGKKSLSVLRRFFSGIGGVLQTLVHTWQKGDWKTRVSYFLMGFGSIARGQWLRGLLFLLFQAVFFLYMALMGFTSLGKLPTLGTTETVKVGRRTVYGDNSFLILLYGVLTLFFILAFFYTWYVNIRQNKTAQQLLEKGKRLKSARDDLSALADSQFHKALLALPALGVTLFTILPIFFMILVAFTNYDAQHQPPQRLFTWVGLENFRTLLSSPSGQMQVDTAPASNGGILLTVTAANGDVLTMETADEEAAMAAQTIADAADAAFSITEEENGKYLLQFFAENQAPVWVKGEKLRYVSTPSYAYTFRQVLFWTLVWAFFATFLNYVLGMMAAILINKRGIRLKKMWRTVLVFTIAVPQFISLLYVSKLFAADGLINGLLLRWGWIRQPLPFWTNPAWARITIIGVNVWVGIPYMMLIATGILMNIPSDLYESARIDGAGAFQTWRKITLPYMLFVTGPYLLTSFTGNINNFNVIFLLSQGRPLSLEMAGNAGSTDLLITWLYKMTVTDSNYKLAAVIGILVFVVCAGVNLLVYNLIPSVKNEEDFQ